MLRNTRIHNNSRSPLVWRVLVSFMGVAVFLLAGCQQKMPEPERTTIARLKSLDPAKVDKQLLARDFIVEGYFVNETVPLLVTDLRLLEINRPLPETSYILLKGNGVEGFGKQENPYGAFIRIKGKLEIGKPGERGGLEIDLLCPDPPEVIRRSELLKPTVYDICRRYPRICETILRFPKKFALLYSGGYNAANAHTRYWNDLKFMYLTLRNKYGYTDANIVVVYKNGTGEDSDMTVDYAATTTGLNDAINYLRSRMTQRDDFFVFVTNHGGGYHQAHAANEGGRADGTPGDEIDAFKYDESIYYYNQSPNEIWDDDFATWLNSLNYARMVAVFEPCFSGGFLHDLKGCNRMLISAASEFEYSWGGGPGNHDMFSYHFTCALNKADHTGAALSPNPDTNGDGSVSILEAFLYAKAKDTASETPLLEDSGDGVGTNSPTATGTDGSLSNTTKL